MPTEQIHLLGAGGHGRVVIDALLRLGWSVRQICVRDDLRELQGTSMLGCHVEWPLRSSHELSGWVHACVGAGGVRRRLLEQSGVDGSRWLTIIHPQASVSSSAYIESGSFVAAQSVLGPCSKVGLGAIVNHGAVVDHDCLVGAFCHVSPLASLGGGVKLGNGVFIGAGARILPGLEIGDEATIGAGSVVLTSVPAGQTWMGVPARHHIRESK